MTTATKSKTPKQIDSVDSYLREVFSLERVNEFRCYRGQVNSTWKPQPSIMRGFRPNAESNVISELLTESPEDFNGDTFMFEKLVRAQHYSLPTRLLDVSLNPLVGLFFACFDRDKKHLETDGQIFIFDFGHSRVKYYDSDVVSLICNLARLKDVEREELEKESKYKDGDKEYDIWVEKFRLLPEMQRLNQFVRVEKPYFLNIAEPADLRKYFAVLPKKSNRRITAQSGAFIVAGLLKYLSLDKSSAAKTTKFTIPHSSKLDILEQLDTLNINPRTMYPEIENVSAYIKDKWQL